MTPTISIFLSVVLVEDYRRRCTDPLVAAILARFPKTSVYHHITLDVATLMQADAQFQGYELLTHGPVMKSYRALVRQIERERRRLLGKEQQHESFLVLQSIVRCWVRYAQDRTTG